MNVLLIVNTSKDKEFVLTNEVIGYLKTKNINIYTDNDALFNQFSLIKLEDNNIENIDFALIIGGDGTVLKYASKYATYRFPFIGINLGRVGALTLLEIDNYKKYIERIINKDYFVVERKGLLCEIDYHNKKSSDRFVCYNDVILHRSSSLKLLPIMISVNNSHRDLFYADGMVVATPSGSSAYNVSAGGPLLASNSSCYVITPICPQSKSFVPLVVSDNDVVNLYLSDKSDIYDNEVTISGDGCYKYFISPLDMISIKKSINGLKMIQFSESDSLYTSVYKAVTSIERGKNNV